MQVLPSNLTQYLLIVAIVVPGIVYQTVRARYQGELPQNRELAGKVLRALAASTIIVLGYAVVFARQLSLATSLTPEQARQYLQDHPTRIALWLVFLVFIVPAALARFAASWTLVRFALLRLWCWALGKAPAARLVRTKAHASTLLTRVGNPVGLRFDQTSSAWDWAVDHAAHRNGFVRIMDSEGQWWGGAFGGASYFSDYPQDPAVYLEVAWTMSDSGEFERKQNGTRGVWIPCKDARVVQFLAADQES